MASPRTAARRAPPIEPQQPISLMSQFQKHRKRHRNKQRPPLAPQRTGLLPHTLKTVEQVWVDYDRLPRDLSDEELSELMNNGSSKPKRGKGKEEGDYAELLKLSLN